MYEEVEVMNVQGNVTYAQTRMYNITSLSPKLLFPLPGSMLPPQSSRCPDVCRCISGLPFAVCFELYISSIIHVNPVVGAAFADHVVCEICRTVCSFVVLAV